MYGLSSDICDATKIIATLTIGCLKGQVTFRVGLSFHM